MNSPFTFVVLSENKPPVLPGEKKGLSKEKEGELKASPKRLKNN